ncbi:MAG: hypothetical protein QUV07_00605 [Cyanobium sp. CZS 25K]|nr:hypothetical protein [Cyanobium sp. CZS25K]
MGLLTSALISLSFVSSSREAKAFSLSPMRLNEPKGIVQISNRSQRSIQVEVNAFPVRIVDGAPTAALEPFPAEVQENLIKFRPHGARVRSNATRNVSYQVLDQTQPFYLCTLTLQDTLLLRICSAWQPSSR